MRVPPHTFVLDRALTIESVQVPWRLREDRADTTAVDCEAPIYLSVPLQSAGARHDLCACYVGEPESRQDAAGSAEPTKLEGVDRRLGATMQNLGQS